LEIYENNKTKDGKRLLVKDFQFHSLQLQYYMLFGTKYWADFDPFKSYKMSLNDVSSLNTYPSFLDNVNDFGAFMAFEFSMEPYTRDALFGMTYWPLFIEHID